MAPQPPDDLGHPSAVVASLVDDDAVVHCLNRYPVADGYLSSARNLWDQLGVPHGDSQSDAPLLQLGKWPVTHGWSW